MAETKIEWATTTWNPVTGCDAISPGCTNCYARRMARRLQAMGQPRYRDGFAVRFHREALEEPLHWRKPRRCFVCSMGDLFHEDVTDEQIAAVFGVMAACHTHQFMVLTKRARRMREWVKRIMVGSIPALYECNSQALRYEFATIGDGGPLHTKRCADPEGPWPLPNVWLGVTAENQAAADERIPLLLDTPAAVRFVSVEPMLGAVDLERYLEPLRQDWCINCDDGPREWLIPDDIPWNSYGYGQCSECGAMRDADGSRDGLNWVICGGESGPGARPMDPAWPRSLRDQCVEAGVPFFFKQWGGVNKKQAERCCTAARGTRCRR